MIESSIITKAKQSIKLQSQEIKNLQQYINNDFEEVVHLINTSKGRLVVSGIGKSAIIAQKIVATLNSTGTPSLYMHAADAIHGDLGMMQINDIIILISKSGESEEIKVLVPLIKNFGNTLIALCGNEKSFLATQANFLLNCTVSKEACPNNLAPTTSTTAQMVMGDAIAICLLELKEFTAVDFAKYHPGGALGKRLYLRVKNLSEKNQSPKVMDTENIKNIIIEISNKRLGATAVLNANNKLLGIITDGDLRRMMEKTENFNAITAKEIMNNNPKQIDENELALNALIMMQENNISQLIVCKNGEFKGFVHLHDLLREGLV